MSMAIKQERVDDIGGVLLVSMNFTFTHKEGFDLWIEYTTGLRLHISNFSDFATSLGEYLQEFLRKKYKTEYLERSIHQHVFMFRNRADRDDARELVPKLILAHKLSYVDPG